jgi:hypothetical protein
LKKQLTAKEFDELLGLVGGDIAQEVGDFVNKKSISSTLFYSITSQTKYCRHRLLVAWAS